MELDFTGLYNITTNAQKPRESHETAQRVNIPAATDKSLQGRLQRRREALDHAEQICKERAEDIRQSELIRADIIKGITAGRPTGELLIQAAEVITLFTHDKAFYTHIKNGVTGQQSKT